MRKEIVWVFGTSAAGKETFIRTAATNPIHRSNLGWQGKKITFCKESIKNLVTIENDPRNTHRDTIISNVEELIKTNDVVLIKWQFLDSDSERVRQLKNNLQNFSHKIIILNASDSEISNRLIKKDWWKPEYCQKDWIENERELLRKDLEQYRDFEIIQMES